MIKNALLILLLATTSMANAQQNVQTRSASDIQALQTRVYEQPYKLVFRTVISVLQDNKYKINFTDMSAGMISAKGTPVASETAPAAAALIPFIGSFIAMVRQESAETWSLAVTLEDVDEKHKETSVRIVITSETETSGMMVNAEKKLANSDLSDRPEVYQDLFAKIQAALFIRENIR